MKVLSIISITAVTIASVFAYNANITNKTNTELYLKAAGQPISSISPNNTVSLELDPYTAYAFSYKGQWADQGLGTIQKYTNLVYQITPVNRFSGISNIEANIQADGTSGYVDNVNDSAGNNVYGGLCNKDTGGITCSLSKGDTLKQLNITFRNI